MLFTFYYKDLSDPKAAYPIAAETLIQRFQNWQTTSPAARKLKIKKPVAKILFFVGCAEGMRSVMKTETFKAVVNTLKPYAI